MLTRSVPSTMAVSPLGLIALATILLGGCGGSSGSAREVQALAPRPLAGPVAVQSEPDPRSQRNYRLWVRWTETRPSGSRFARGTEGNQVYAEEQSGLRDYTPRFDTAPAAVTSEQQIDPQPQGEIRGTTAARRAAPN